MPRSPAASRTEARTGPRSPARTGSPRSSRSTTSGRRPGRATPCPCRCISTSSSTTSRRPGASARRRCDAARRPAQLRPLPRVCRPGRPPVLPLDLGGSAPGQRPREPLKTPVSAALFVGGGTMALVGVGMFLISPHLAGLLVAVLGLAGELSGAWVHDRGHPRRGEVTRSPGCSCAGGWNLIASAGPQGQPCRVKPTCRSSRARCPR